MARATLVVSASLLLLFRPALERGPPPLNPFTVCSTAYRVHNTTTRTPRARWRRALVATGRGATCNPGCCSGRLNRSASSSTHAHAHTRSLKSTHTHTPDEHAHARTHTRTHTRARAHTHTHTHTHTRTLMCAHRHTSTQKQIHTHKRGASLGAVAGRDAPQPICAQMGAEVGANAGGSERKTWRSCRHG